MTLLRTEYWLQEKLLGLLHHDSKFFHPWFWFMSWSSDKCLFIFSWKQVFFWAASQALVYWKWFFFCWPSYIRNQFCHKISVSYLFFSLEILLMVFYYVWVLLLFRRRNVERAWVLQLWDFSSFWICMNFSFNPYNFKIFIPLLLQNALAYKSLLLTFPKTQWAVLRRCKFLFSAQKIMIQ